MSRKMEYKLPQEILTVLVIDSKVLQSLRLENRDTLTVVRDEYGEDIVIS